MLTTTMAAANAISIGKANIPGLEKMPMIAVIAPVAAFASRMITSRSSAVLTIAPATTSSAAVNASARGESIKHGTLNNPPDEQKNHVGQASVVRKCAHRSAAPPTRKLGNLTMPLSSSTTLGVLMLRLVKSQCLVEAARPRNDMSHFAATQSRHNIAPNERGSAPSVPTICHEKQRALSEKLPND